MNPVDFSNIVLYKGYLHAAVGWHFLYFPNRFLHVLAGWMEKWSGWTNVGHKMVPGWMAVGWFPSGFFLLLLHFSHFVAGWMEKLSGWTNISKRSLI